MCTPKTLVQRALRGLTTSRPVVGPLAVHFCAPLSGISLQTYTLDSQAMARSILRYYERFRPDAIWVSADTWVSAEAAGARVGFSSSAQPMGGKGSPVIQNHADIDRLPPPDPFRQGRCPVMLEALRYVSQALGDTVFVVACFDQFPFSLACALMGIERVMLAVHDDRPMLEALMARCVDYGAAYAAALSDAGADMLSGGDSPAGLLGPLLYREIALPAEQQLIRRIKVTASQPVSLHICGNTTSIVADMAASGADVLELDHEVRIRDAIQQTGPEIALWGNLDAVALLAQGTPGAIRAATQELLDTVAAVGHWRFVVSSGCTLAVETPPENLQALIDAAVAYKW